MANEPSLDEMTTALQELYKTNPHILEGIRTNTDPDIIEQEYYRNLPKMIKKDIASDIDIINQDPNYYMRDFTFEEAIDIRNELTKTSLENNEEKRFRFEIGCSLFKLYESQQQNIYSAIQQDDLLESLNEDTNAFLIDIFATDSRYNKDRISFKTKQEIQCVSTNPIVESYITQCKKDWPRTPFFSNKYNKYVVKLTGLPYMDDSPAVDKLFLITVDAINNYFIQEHATPAIGLEIIKEEQIDETLGKTDCECKKIKNTLICSEFNILPDLTYNVKKILYNLSFVNQTQKSQIMLQFTALLQAFPEEYDKVIQATIGDEGYMSYNLGHGAGYYYIDAQKQAFVYLNNIILVVIYKGDTFYVPLYNVVQVYPFAMNDYYYSFLFVDNNPPAAVGQGKWYERAPKTPVTVDFYKFLIEKIQWYMRKYDENPDNFIRGNYRGADYISYIKKEAKEYNKMHKPYVFTYKTRPFKEPDFSRLLGGKTMRMRMRSKSKSKRMRMRMRMRMRSKSKSKSKSKRMRSKSKTIRKRRNRKIGKYTRKV
jgi:hypothetical protein